MSGVKLSQALRGRAISPIDAIDAVIARTERINPALLAFCTPTFEQARRDAAVLEQRLAAGDDPGPLAGVPVSIKDLIFTCGIRTTGGCVAYSDLVPKRDDVVVERLRAAGAIILGKTNVSELGYSLTGDNPVFGVTRNPWDPTRSSGGSSAGAAVAVATGMGPLAIGSDGGGSIRVPAAFCGVFGFKPSMGRVPLHPGCRDETLPGLSSWETLEHIGPLSRTVADAALVMSVITGPDARDRHSLPAPAPAWLEGIDADISGKRVAFCPLWGGFAVASRIATAIRLAATAFERDLGCRVEEVNLGFPNLVGQFRTLIMLDSDLKGLRTIVDRHGDRISTNIRNLVHNRWTAEDFSEAQKARKAIVNQMWQLMERFDFLITPTTACDAPSADKSPDAEDFVRPLPVFTCVANMTGQPAASVPVPQAEGLPIGLQIVGRHLADRDVLNACAAFEQAHPWSARWPAI